MDVICQDLHNTRPPSWQLKSILTGNFRVLSCSEILEAFIVCVILGPRQRISLVLISNLDTATRSMGCLSAGQAQLPSQDHSTSLLLQGGAHESECCYYFNSIIVSPFRQTQCEDLFCKMALVWEFLFYHPCIISVFVFAALLSVHFPRLACARPGTPFS